MARCLLSESGNDVATAPLRRILDSLEAMRTGRPSGGSMGERL